MRVPFVVVRDTDVCRKADLLIRLKQNFFSSAAAAEKSVKILYTGRARFLIRVFFGLLTKPETMVS